MTRPPAGFGLVAFFCLAGVAYAMASPYGAPPDEPTHYVKALGTGGGDLLGSPARWDAPRGSARQNTYIDTVTRRFHVPDRLAPPADDPELCFILRPSQPADCPPGAASHPQHLSYVGVYPPLPYLVPGLATRFGWDKHSALLAARLAGGFSCAVLVGIAVAALRSTDRPRAMSLVGIAIVLWPDLMFLAWGLNPNGIEAVASLAFVATLLGLTRDEGPPTWLWLGAAASGFVLCGTRPVSPVWVLFGLLLAVALVGPRQALRRLRSGGRYAVVFGVALAAGLLGTLAWTVAMHSHLQPDPASLQDRAVVALRTVPDWVHLDMVGKLAWGEVSLPSAVYDAWTVVLAMLVLLALVVGTWRQRLACLLMVVAFLGMAVVLFETTHPSGFPMGGRYLQAGMTALPLLWVEVVYRNRHKLPRPAVIPGVGVVVVLVAATQLDALFLNGRRFAVGVGGPVGYLLHHSLWTPPAGWLPWVASALVGAVALVAGFALDLRER